MGQSILPGVDNTIQANKDRWNQIQSSYQAITPTSETVSRIGSNLDVSKDLSDQAWDAMRERETRYSDDIGDTIRGQYGAMETNVGNAYDDMRRQARDVYGNLIEGSGATYDEALKDLQVLKPGGEAAMARSSRAYAPAVAATMRRLRGSGIDPNSPEGSAALQRVESSRARGMEDAAVEQTKDYVEKSTGLKLSKEQTRAALGLGGLGAETGLQKEKTGLLTGLGEKKTGLVVSEKIRTLGAQQGIQEKSLQSAQDWLGQKNNLELLRKSLETQDWATGAEILKGMNEEDIRALGLLAEQYGLGERQQILDLAQRNLGATQVGGIGQQQTNAALAAAQAARGFGSDALKDSLASYGLEAPSAGWGTKLLGGLAGGALNLVAPGAGTALSGAVGGGGGGAYDLSSLQKLFGGGSPGTVDFSNYYKQWGF
ncbi:MAG TPA: hypothetical protein VNA25_20570 [Phycisphaerae bacterium]|nr:hypothetical protein [Phycisphaerae bacterium]